MKLTKYLTLITAIATIFVGCGIPEENKGNEATGNIVLSAEDTVEVKTPINFVVTNNEGEDVTAEATIYDKSHDFVQVTNPYTPTEDDDYIFYAVVGDYISNDFTVIVTPTVPALPEDSNSANTSFEHRLLLVDHTGNTCGYCPRMMLALKEVSETGDYHSKYYEAMAHSYAGTDPAYSGSAAAISTYFAIVEYPSLTYNFAYSTISSYNAEHIKQQIDKLWKESAEAGIAAATSMATKSVVVNAEVKAAVTGEYSINAWLLEDGIEATQINGTEDWMDIHNNAIRQAATTKPITGYELGNIEAGKTATRVLNLKITSNKWNRDNMKVMLIVSKKGDNGVFDVANVALCDINDTISYNYNN